VSGVVDLVVGIIFVFLVFSLVVSGVIEAITRLVEWRSRHLWRALRQLLDGDGQRLTADQRPEAKKLTADQPPDAAGLPLTDQLYVHPLIRQLEGRLPSDRSRLSRIPAVDFSRALIDLLAPNEAGKTSLEQVRERVVGLSADSPLRVPLLVLIREADGRIEQLQKGIEAWYDARMEALSRAYKRHVKWVLLAVGLVVALAFNVDALGAAERIYRDEALRSAVAQQAIAVVEGCEGKSDVAACTREQVENVDSAIRLPVGWPDPNGVGALQVLGWLIAGVALGQGAPFWFDLLRKAGKLRG
jgi:hypothetical protein